MGNAMCADGVNEFLLEGLIDQLNLDDFNLSFPGFEELVKKVNKMNSSKKSEKVSLNEYREGKQALAENRNEEALNLFTNALVAAPGSSKHIALYYIDRSIALQKLKAYPESLQDIKRALNLSVTEEQKKALERRKTIITSLIAKDDLRKLKIEENDEEEKEEITYGESEELVGVSSALSLVYNEKFGRHYIANRDIEVGDVLMIQKPFVHIILPERIQLINEKKKRWFCDNCLSIILNPIPCENCTTVIYCTDECKLKAYKKFHDIECYVTRKYPSAGEALALRSLIKATNKGEKLEEVYNTMEEIDNSKDKRTTGFNNGKLNGDKPEVLLSLLAHMDKRNETLHATNAAFVANVLRKETDFLKGRCTRENTVKIGRLYLKLSYICQMNGYGMQGKCSIKRIALGMYPVFNYLNNSCANNTIWYDKEGQKILRACKDIKKGEQAFVSYMSTDVINKTAEERKNFFKTIKFFNCECEACKNNYNFKCELKRRLKIPPQLKKKLVNKPNDTKSLWELLKLLVNEYKGPCLEGKHIEAALINAHLGSKNEEVPSILRLLRIL